MVLTNVGVLTEVLMTQGFVYRYGKTHQIRRIVCAMCWTRCSTSSRQRRLYHFDFVDLSDLSLVNLPSLLGLPKEN